ncbi:MAG: O-antigen ligase family protein [Actinomycetota bacterium]|nr:O-antigen ligase family protein [Actinomycetota bacterium]
MRAPQAGAALLRHGPGARRAILLALIFGIPTLFLWGVTYDAFNVPKLALLTIGLSCCAGIRLVEAVCGRSFAHSPLLWPASFVLVPLAVAWLATDYKTWSLLGAYGRYEGLIPTLLIVLAGVLVADTFGGNLRDPARAMAASALVVSLYTIAQSVGLDPLNVPMLPDYAPSTIGQSNFVGGFLAISLPVVLALWWTEEGWGQRAAIGTAIFTTLGLVFAFSQGGWAAAVAALAAFGGLARRAKRRHLIAGLGIAGVVAIAVVGVVVAGLFLPADSVVPATARARGLWWRSALEMAWDSPVWGHGPNVFAIEGGHHRVLEDALAHEMGFADAPHSVPLSLFANAGLLGLLGFTLLAVWTIRLLIRSQPYTVLRAGFGAAAIAYFVQSLVSLDSLVLGFALWVCLGALGASAATGRPPQSEGVQRPRWAVALGLGAGVLLILASVSWSVRFVRVDAEIVGAVEAFEEKRFDEGETAFDKALGLRFDPHYKSLFIGSLGRAALSNPSHGHDYISKMRSESTYLKDFPSIRFLSSYADWMHQWSVYMPAVEGEALRALLAGRRLDPYNPVSVVSTAEALVHSGRPEDAARVAARLQDAIEDELPDYRERYPEIPAMVAIAAHAAGNDATARSSLQAAMTWSPRQRASNCHVVIATELVLGQRMRSFESVRNDFPNLRLCPPATLALLPRFEPTNSQEIEQE